jgi:VanZ family protein
MVKKNFISMSIAMVILFLSFTGAGTFSHLKIPQIPHIDKLVHFIMYFTLMFALIVENRHLLVTAGNYLFLGTIPVLFGAVIEIFQSMFTATRTGDFFDFCANVTGVLFSVLVWLAFKWLINKRVK